MNHFLFEVSTATELLKLGLDDLKSFEATFRDEAALEEVRGLKDQFLASRRMLDKSLQILSGAIAKEHESSQPSISKAPPFFIERQANRNSKDLVLEAIGRLCEIQGGTCKLPDIVPCVAYSRFTVSEAIKTLMQDGKIHKPHRGAIATGPLKEQEVTS